MVFFYTHREKSGLGLCFNVLDVYRFWTLISLSHFKFHIVTFLERTWGLALVDEYVLAPVGRCDESEPLC